MSEEKKMGKSNFGLWIIGQFVSFCIGCLVSFEYTFSAGIAVFFALCVLIDIRGNVGK